MIKKISVIVPVFNDAVHLKTCLRSIVDSSHKEVEVIVVDDASRDNSSAVAGEFNCRIITLEKRSGVAAARNTGARQATAELLYFVDSDIVQEEDTVKNIMAHFEKDKTLTSVSAYWAKDSMKKGLFPEFLGLKHYFLFIDTFGRKRAPFSVINSGALAIRKSVFDELGGFNEKYPDAGGEEYDFSKRLLAKNYFIPYFLDVCVGHHFKNFFPTLKNVYRRTRRWIGLFSESGKFETIGNATKSEAMTAVVAVSALACLLSALIDRAFFAASGFLLAVLIIRNIMFYRFVGKEKGWLFVVPAIGFDVCVYASIGTGAAHGFLRAFTGRGAHETG